VTLMLSAPFVVADTWDMHDWGGDGWWVMMGIGMLLFWGLVIAGIVLIMRELSGPRHDRGREDPLDILKGRLAQGDISVEEYERHRQALERSGRT
jgi:putative membrane protein